MMPHLRAHYPVFKNGKYDTEETRSIRTESDVTEFVEILADDETGDASFTVAGDPESDSLLVAGIRDGNRGALYYVDEQGEFYSKGSGPTVSVVYDQDDYPPYCEVPLESIRLAIAEYLQTASRPHSMQWQTR
jgi:hypothetical protein